MSACVAPVFPRNNDRPKSQPGCECISTFVPHMPGKNILARALYKPNKRMLLVRLGDVPRRPAILMATASGMHRKSMYPMRSCRRDGILPLRSSFGAEDPRHREVGGPWWLARTSARARYAAYRFPAEIIGHALWLYFRFPLGLRIVEELLAARHHRHPRNRPIMDAQVRSAFRQPGSGYLRKLLKKQMRSPRVMITDKLAIYGAAKREVMPGIAHRQHRG